jgi:hypothetical protein
LLRVRIVIGPDGQSDLCIFRFNRACHGLYNLVLNEN